MCKELRFMEQVVMQHHPDWKVLKGMTKIIRSTPQAFNIPRLYEETLAAVGGYNFIDGAHKDFDDIALSDAKTASVSPKSKKYPNGNYGNSHHVEIGGVISGGGVEKAGSLRTAIYNPILDVIHYFYIPKKDWLEMSPHVSGTSKMARLTTSYNAKTDHYNKFEPFRVDTFHELATRMD